MVPWEGIGESMEHGSEGTGVRAVERTVALLLAFTELGTELGVTELARHLGLAKSVVHRSLVTLIRTGFLVQDKKTGLYRLGPQALGLGLAALGQVDLPRLALPFMEKLRSATKETVTLSMLIGDYRVYVAQLESPQDVRMTVELGKRWPLYAGASGRAILANLPQHEIERYLSSVQLAAITSQTITSSERLMAKLAEVRSLGYAVSGGERDPWAAAVASAISAKGRGIVGSISVCGPLPRFTPDRIHEYCQLVKTSAAAISAALGASEQTE